MNDEEKTVFEEAKRKESLKMAALKGKQAAHDGGLLSKLLKAAAEFYKAK